MQNLEPHEKVWKGNLRELSYDFEDCIDRFMDRLGSGDAKPKFMKRTMRRLKTLWKRHEIAKEIQDLKARVLQESQRRERYKLDNRSRTSSFVEIDPRLPALYEEVKGLVAIEGPMEKIVGWLMEEKAELKVIAIVGGGGLGNRGRRPSPWRLTAKLEGTSSAELLCRCRAPLILTSSSKMSCFKFTGRSFANASRRSGRKSN
jgi:hypothetical protein